MVTKAQEKIYFLMQQYPNDFIVLAFNPGRDYFISEPYTYYESAKKEHNRLINTLNIDFKVSIYKLNREDLKEHLKVVV